MTLIELDRDVSTGLALLRDSSDPPRYYVQERRHRALLAIGNLATASERFISWVKRQASGDTGGPRHETTRLTPSLEEQADLTSG